MAFHEGDTVKCVSAPARYHLTNGREYQVIYGHEISSDHTIFVRNDLGSRVWYPSKWFRDPYMDILDEVSEYDAIVDAQELINVNG